MISIENIGLMYNKYANGSVSPATPLNRLASIETVRAVKSAGDTKVRAGASKFTKSQGRALQGAAIASALPVMAFKLPELLLGTGLHSRGAVDVTTKEGLNQHVEQCYRSPCDAGLAGLWLGLHAGFCVAAGTLIGASIGFIAAGLNAVAGNFLHIDHSKEDIVKLLAAAGGITGAAIGCCLGGLQEMFAINVLRTVLSATKVAVTAPFAAAGYVVGGMVGLGTALMQNDQRPEPARSSGTEPSEAL